MFFDYIYVTELRTMIWREIYEIELCTSFNCWRGLSGLASALFLAKHNIEYLLIERHPSTAIHPKAGGLTLRTMELFRELGLEKELNWQVKD